MRYISLLVFVAQLFAQENYSLRAAYGLATQNDLVEILLGDVNSHPKNLSVIAVDGGYLLQESAFELPVDIYLKGSLSRFDESAVQRDALYETTLYVKAYWNFDFLENRARFGLGEGASYTSDILFVEYEEAIAEDGKNSHFLNYLDLSLDFDVGKLAGAKTLYETYIGWALKHRSGIFGLVNNVKRGGSNYNTLYIEKNF